MLDLRRNDVLTLVPQGKEGPFDREIVRFAAATREHDLVRITAKQTCNLSPRIFQSVLRGHARPMPARRVANSLVQEWTHRGGDPGVDRRARVVIEIHHGCLGSFITRLTTLPERKVTTAIATIAERSPKQSAMSPALTAPMA